ncbi:MAG: DUF3987 domain-containing protein [Steroidobacteraceae bacterium]
MSAEALVTVWRDHHGNAINAARVMSLEELERVIRAAPSTGDPTRTVEQNKDKLPLLKLARFGETWTMKKGKKTSLRHDANVLAVTGTEGDYDGEMIPMSHAAEALSAAGVAAILYTSARHTPEAPRWRVIVALSHPLEGTVEEMRQQRKHWTGVLNAILGGVLTEESFVLSQSYYFGPIAGRPAPEIIRLEGCCIDEMQDTPEPLFPGKTAKANGAEKANGTHEGATLDGIASGEHIFQTTRDYAARLIAKGLSKDESLELLRGYLLGHKAAWTSTPEQLARWDEVWEKLERMIDGAVEKEFAPADGSASKTPAEWPEPVNILSELGAPAFTGEELPPTLAEYSLAYARATGFDLSLILASALAVAAAALSDEFQIVGDSASEWFQKPLLWVLTIGRPGSGKTPVQKAMLAQLWAIHRELDAQWRDQVAALAMSEDEQKAPPRPRVVVVDTTIEALTEVLRDNPRGILIANDEFESWLGSLDAYRRGAVSRDRGEWLRLFDGGPHTVERVQRGSVYIPNWGSSILTATTPAALAKLARSLPEDGLLQRFLPIVVQPKREPQPVADLEAIRERFHETITRLYSLTPHSRKGCVPLSPAAAEFFKAWSRQHQVRQEAFGTLEPALESHLAKYPNFLLRITLTLHAVNVVSHDATGIARDPAAFPVPLATIEAAAKFLKRASMHAMAVYLNRSGGSEAYELAREVGRAIVARGWQSVARRNLIQGVHAFRKATQELQDSTLRLFGDIGWLAQAEGGYAKPTPARYGVNPKVHEKFAATAERERERRAVIREAIAEAAEHRRAEPTEGKR